MVDGMTIGVSYCHYCGTMTHTLLRGEWRLCSKCKMHKVEEETKK